jgi:hypothetical protein
VSQDATPGVLQMPGMPRLYIGKPLVKVTNNDGTAQAAPSTPAEE